MVDVVDTSITIATDVVPATDGGEAINWGTIVGGVVLLGFVGAGAWLAAQYALAGRRARRAGI